MKRYLFLLYLVLTTILHAQTFRWGETSEHRRYVTIPIHFHSTRDGGTIILLARGKQLWLERYDKNLHLQRRTAFRAMLEKKKLSVVSFLATQKGFFVISMGRDWATKEFLYFAHQVDTASVSVAQPTLLLRSATPLLSDGRSDRKLFGVQIALSPDSSKVLFLSTVRLDKYHGLYVLNVYDATLSQRLKEKKLMLHNSKQLYINNIYIDNNAKILMGAIRVPLKLSARWAIASIISIPGLNKDPIEYKVEIPGCRIVEILLSVASSGELVAGFYYMSASKRGASGVGGFRMDQATGKVKDLVRYPFEKKYIKMFTHYSRKYKTIYGFSLKDIISLPDGGFVLIGEQSFLSSKIISYQGDRGYFNTNMALAISFRPDNSLAWMTIIPKLGRAREIDMGLSYLAGQYDGKIFMLYNDHPRNLGYPGTVSRLSRPRSRSTVVTFATLDASGRLERKIISSRSASETWLMPLYYEQLTPTRWVFLGWAMDQRGLRIGDFSY